MSIEDRDPSKDEQGAADEDATVVRNSDGKEPESLSGADGASVVRPQEPGPADPSQPGADDATVIRGDEPQPSHDASGADDATVIRGIQPTQSTTQSGSDDATVVRTGDSATQRDDEIGQDDATVIRADDGPGDDDATVINPQGADDSTVLNTGQATQQEADTTYIAAVGAQQPDDRGSSQAGRLLKNRYVLEEKLGSGGMGDVYKALDLRAQEAQDRNPYVAIKLLNERFSQHKDAFISLQREASKTRSMHSPNIMGVYDFDREGDNWFMAMELLDGEPLDDFLKSHPEGVSHEDAWTIIEGYCLGLKAAHAANIVHSDFKPGNIYYTENKIAKVFDFGIARAVQNPGTAQEGKEETVFDPGSLGALTPTYASYEMLTGEVPSKSDDVYAAALVAYELFTGTHPYKRVPADKALAQGLEPEPVPFLKRRHWRALKRGLALRGEDRTPTIDEFMEGMFSEDLPILRYSIIGVVLAGVIGFSTYSIMFAPEANQELIAAQSELQLRKDDFEVLIDADKQSERMYTEQWTADVRETLGLLFEANNTLVEEFSQLPDPAVAENQRLIMEGHASQIRSLNEKYTASGDLADNQENYLERAEELMFRLKNYFPFDEDVVRSAELGLRNSIKLRDIERTRIAEEDARARAAQDEADRIAAEAEARRLADERRDNRYIEDARELKEIYKCKDGIADLPALRTLISRMETTFPEQYATNRAGIVGGLYSCIDRTKVKRPDHARKIKEMALTIFPDEESIARINISDLDPCAKRNLIGSGSRSRSWCEDDLQDGGKGPELVVIPESRKIPMFAISRTEINVGDYNAYCERAGCERIRASSSTPVTGITADQARAYVAWLSDQSGRTYRLPTVEEWTYAAKTDAEEPVDPNVNCTVDSRGVRLGETLVSVLSGKPNRWGLYNHVGNAQEWAVDGDKLMALGGAHTDPKATCSIELSRNHTGEADAVTGFRVLRVISRSS